MGRSVSTSTSTTVVSWGGWEDNGPESTPRALLFGAILDRAWPIVKEYRSDLYRDATQIREANLSPGKTYWFVVREWGTHWCYTTRTQEGGVLSLETVLNVMSGQCHVWRIDCHAGFFEITEEVQ